MKEEKIYFMEVHRAREMIAIVKNIMSLVDKLANPIIRLEIKNEMNRVSQYLSANKLRIVTSEQLKNISGEVTVGKISTKMEA